MKVDIDDLYKLNSLEQINQIGTFFIFKLF